MIPKSDHLEAADDTRVQMVAAGLLLSALLIFGAALTADSGAKYWVLSALGREAPARVVAQAQYIHRPDRTIDTYVLGLVNSKATLDEVTIEWSLANGATSTGRFVVRAGTEAAEAYRAMIGDPDATVPVVYLPLDPRLMSPAEILPEYRTDAFALMWFAIGIVLCLTMSALAARAYFRSVRGRANY